MEQQQERLHLPRTLKIGSFHIGSAFADILGSAVWNRILISDLGIIATPVALLAALRYLLAPLSIWAGHRSDTHPLFGLRRLPYIWLGRALMLLSLPLLPVATVLLAADAASVWGWVVATISFLIYGLGTLLSGSPFLALVRDSAPPSKRGQALSIVQIILVVSFAFAPAVYGWLMPEYSPSLLWRSVLIGAALAALFWIFSILGEEQRGMLTAAAKEAPFMETLRSIWGDVRARTFFIFLALGATSAFAQDAVLEPFGGDLFGLSVGETTRFNAYWGVGVLVGMIGTAVITRRRASADQSGTTMIGLALTAIPLALLGVVALTRMQALLIPVLVLFGFGFGIYTVGAISLLMAMTLDQHAGAYLGLWSVAQLVFRGVGIAVGGILRDVVLVLTGSFSLAYAAVFMLEAVGLLACIFLLARIDVKGFARGEEAPVSPLAALAD